MATVVMQTHLSVTLYVYCPFVFLCRM